MSEDTVGWWGRNDMRFWKWTISVMIAVLVVGCATYPVGYWVNPTLDDYQRSENDRFWCNLRFENWLMACDPKARENADRIVSTAKNKWEGGQYVLPIYLIMLPRLVENEQLWANVYTNMIKACMEEEGYRWVNDPKGKKIKYMKVKSFAPSQIDESR